MNMTSTTQACQDSEHLPCIKGRWNFSETELAPGTSAWESFAETWHDMPVDRFMADGGTYRYRRFSEFRVQRAQGGIKLLPHVPYLQSKQLNYLNGGVDRAYEPMLEAAAASPVFRQILLRTADILGEATDEDEFLVQVFQNRIVADDAAAGQPTPEGRHRDGVDFVLSLLISRAGVAGGTSQVHTAAGDAVGEMLMAEPGDFMLLDDEAMRHAVTPLVPVARGVPGHRDVLIAMYSAWRPGLR